MRAIKSLAEAIQSRQRALDEREARLRQLRWRLHEQDAKAVPSSSNGGSSFFRPSLVTDPLLDGFLSGADRPAPTRSIPGFGGEARNLDEELRRAESHRDELRFDLKRLEAEVGALRSQTQKTHPGERRFVNPLGQVVDLDQALADTEAHRRSVADQLWQTEKDLERLREQIEAYDAGRGE